jgi:hypothetical protein
MSLPNWLSNCRAATFSNFGESLQPDVCCDGRVCVWKGLRAVDLALAPLSERVDGDKVRAVLAVGVHHHSAQVLKGKKESDTKRRHDVELLW